MREAVKLRPLPSAAVIAVGCRFRLIPMLVAIDGNAVFEVRALPRLVPPAANIGLPYFLLHR